MISVALTSLPKEFRALAWQHLRTHLARRPADNAVRRIAAHLADDLPLLRERGLNNYHLWTFGTVRQLGAAFALAARGLACQGADQRLAARPRRRGV